MTLFCNLLKCRVHARLQRDIADVCLGIPVFFRDFGCNRLEGLLIDVEKPNTCPAIGKPQRNCATDATAGTSHDREFAVEAKGMRVRFQRKPPVPIRYLDCSS